MCAKKTKLLTVGNDVQTSRVILKLATLTTDDSNDVLLRQCVQTYNDSHEQVQVVLEDYAMRGETREQAMLTLITDLLTPGHAPELLDCRVLSRIQYNSLARQGIFMDVSDLLSDRTAFVTALWKPALSMMRCIVLFRLIRFRASSDARISLACHFRKT